MSKLRLIAFASAAALALVACGKNAAPATDNAAGADQTTASEDNGDAMPSAAAPSESAAPAAAPDYDAIAQAAVASADRPADDVARDAQRKPAETLAFMEIAPGQKVFEVEAGKGYYTELMSRVVGPTGSVVMQEAEPLRKYVADSRPARLGDNRLPNVRESFTNFDQLDAADGSIDLVTWVWGPHELYFYPDGVSLGDPAKSYAEIFRVLKPGGIFVVIDHAAVPGSPETTGGDLHRIDKAIVVNLAQAAGFVIDAESDFLANPNDPMTAKIFDPSIRGNTSQFAVRFKKPQ
ncbi:MAG TPA: class I SAM-dependent methyltransferase [Parvularculaceae bacterium]|nr:class I SAM-dependent methyltransferase [Parvularculaceae bacterium]